MKLIEYLKQHGLDTLKEKFKIKATFSKKHPELVCLVYDQLETPKTPVTNDCRGIVINANTFEVISYPFTRFNDYNAKQPTEFDKNNFQTFEKIDGSLVSLYFYNNQWNISTKSQPDASGLIRGIDKIYSEYFFESFDKLKMSKPKNTDLTYVFEFKFPSETQFTTKTDKTSITLIGCRNVKTFKEVSLNEIQAEQSDWSVVKDMEFASFEDVLAYVKTLNPSVSEGVVVCDQNFNRYKIKSPAYELIALLRKPTDSFSKNIEIEKNNKVRLAKIIQCCDFNDFLNDFEDLKSYWKKLKSAKKQLIHELFKLKKRLNVLQPNQFGQVVKGNKTYEKIAFQLKQAESVEIYLENCPDKTFVELLTTYVN